MKNKFENLGFFGSYLVVAIPTFIFLQDRFFLERHMRILSVIFGCLSLASIIFLAEATNQSRVMRITLVVLNIIAILFFIFLYLIAGMYR